MNDMFTLIASGNVYLGKCIAEYSQKCRVTSFFGPPCTCHIHITCKSHTTYTAE